MITRLFKEIRKFFAPPEKFTKTELQHFCAGPTIYNFEDFRCHIYIAILDMGWELDLSNSKGNLDAPPF